MNDKFAVISDIHSNIQALEAVLLVLQEEGIDTIYCLGDVVGYGANPNEAVELIQNKADGRTVMGNHDKAIANSDLLYLESFNYDAKMAIEYQKKVISADNRKWLHALPETIREEDILFCHGSPLSIEHYVLTEGDIWLVVQVLQDNAPWLLFFGHTHIPLVVNVNKNGSMDVIDLQLNEKADKFVLNVADDGFYFINPGSVGQPRDNFSSASFVIVDREAKTICFKRVKYNVEEAKRRIISANLPTTLAERLEYGM